jgi:hypothetical protein
MKITSRMPRAEYDAIDALNITKLKEMKRSPLHFRAMIENPKVSAPLTLGIATHVAVLEPERYGTEFTTWDRLTDGGNSAPRRGQYWDAFVATAGKKTILTPDQNTLANAIAAAVRFNPTANRYLETGDPEVSLEWTLPAELGARRAKGRVDWFTVVDGRPCLVGLKTSRDCRHFQFSRQAANLGYHLAWAYYVDGYKAIKGIEPRCVEIVVESAAPHAVKVYNIPNELILQGRDEYWECVKQLRDCEQSGEWPAPGGDAEEDLTLPSWAYGQDGGDLEGLELTGDDA